MVVFRSEEEAAVVPEVLVFGVVVFSKEEVVVLFSEEEVGSEEVAFLIGEGLLVDRTILLQAENSDDTQNRISSWQTAPE